MSAKSPEVRIVFFSDTHLGFDSPLHPRVRRRRRGIDFFDNYTRVTEFARVHKPDMVIHGGDLFYRNRIPDSLISKAFQPLLAIADSGIPIYLVPGNHERSEIRPTLFDVHPLIHIFNKPRTFKRIVGRTTVSLSGFPFCRENIRDKFQYLLEDTGWHRTPGSIRLLCMHQAVEGAAVGTQHYTFRYGSDVVRGSDIPHHVDAVLSGHIHRFQVLRRSLGGDMLPAPVMYPGATERTSFAERIEEKGFLTVQLSESGLTYQFRPLPTRRMYDIVVKDAGRTACILHSLDRHGIVRLSYPAGAAPNSAEIRSIAPPTMNVYVRTHSERYKH